MAGWDCSPLGGQTLRRRRLSFKRAKRVALRLGRRRRPGRTARKDGAAASEGARNLEDAAVSTPERQRHATARPSPAKQSMCQVRMSFGGERLGLILLDGGADVAEDDGAVTREALLARDHLLLPPDVAAGAVQVCGQMLLFASIWSGDEAGLNEHLWEVYLLPAAERAVRQAERGSHAGALADLLGVLLFTLRRDAWLQQAGLHPAELCSYLRHLSSAWASVLAQGDGVLGLAPRAGRPGGYRPRLRALLQSWQERIHHAIEAGGLEGRHAESMEASVMEP